MLPELFAYLDFEVASAGSRAPLRPEGCWTAAPPAWQFLQGAAGAGEAFRADDLRPVFLDLGDPVAGVVERLAAAGGGEDELGPLVGAVGPAFQVAEALQVAD